MNEVFLTSYDLCLYAGGCEFSCPYCDGVAFHSNTIDSDLHVYTDIPQRLAKELTDIPTEEVFGLGRGEAYQPAEKKYRLTRQVLNVLNDHKRSIDERLMDKIAQLYGNKLQPPLWYRQQLNRRLLALCEDHHLPPRIPTHIYENTLAPEIVAELRRRNQEFVD